MPSGAPQAQDPGATPVAVNTAVDMAAGVHSVPLIGGGAPAQDSAWKGLLAMGKDMLAPSTWKGTSSDGGSRSMAMAAIFLEL